MTHRGRIGPTPLAGVYVSLTDSALRFPRHWHGSYGLGVIDRGAQRSSSGRGAVEAVAVACEVIFILGQRRLSAPIAPLAMAALMSAGGLLLALPAAAAAWYAWVPTVVGFWLWYAGARRATATQAAVSTAWLPLVTVVGAAALLGETLALSQLAALGLVLAGVFIGSVARPRAV